MLVSTLALAGLPLLAHAAPTAVHSEAKRDRYPCGEGWKRHSVQREIPVLNNGQNGTIHLEIMWEVPKLLSCTSSDSKSTVNVAWSHEETSQYWNGDSAQKRARDDACLWTFQNRKTDTEGNVFDADKLGQCWENEDIINAPQGIKPITGR